MGRNVSSGDGQRHSGHIIAASYRLDANRNFLSFFTANFARKETHDFVAGLSIAVALDFRHEQDTSKAGFTQLLGIIEAAVQPVSPIREEPQIRVCRCLDLQGLADKQRQWFRLRATAISPIQLLRCFNSTHEKEQRQILDKGNTPHGCVLFRIYCCFFCGSLSYE